MDPLYVPSKIRTFSGNYVNVFEPDHETLVIEDIAHALSMQCRYGGHSPIFYSVATHCLWMVNAMITENQQKDAIGNFTTPKYTREELFAALMHDASEAFLVDIPKPIKLHLKQYNEVEDNLMQHLAVKFGFTYPLPTVVKEWDVNALEWEWEHVVCAENPIDFGLTHRETKYAFLHTYDFLKP